MSSTLEPSDNTTSSPPVVPNPLVNAAITRSLGSDYEALKNDLDQANEFAADLQKEVAVSKNDAAHFKQLFAKTRQDLEHLQESIVALRQERHAFANEVMVARGMEAKLKVVSEERDRHACTIVEMQQREEETAETIRKRDVQIAELTMQVMMLKNTFRQTQQQIASGSATIHTRKTASIERFGD